MLFIMHVIYYDCCHWVPSKVLCELREKEERGEKKGPSRTGSNLGEEQPLGIPLGEPCRCLVPWSTWPGSPEEHAY